MVEKAWSDPVVLCGFGLTVVAMLGTARDGAGAGRLTLAAAWLGASKQFSPVIAFPLAFALPARSRTRVLLGSVALVAATLLPFAIWDPVELWRDLGATVFAYPFRTDALTWLVPAALVLGKPLPSLVGVVAFVTVLALTVRPGATTAQAVRASAAGFLAFLLFNKAAFCNYYWLAIGLLLFATVLSALESADAAPT
jgi:hypothetical protein